MTATVRRCLLLAAVLSLATSLAAEEGMWMPQQVPELAERLAALGFTGDPQAFADLTGQPMGAIVHLGGCSASFVSPDGLIVTNHHCAVSALQYNSTPERNLLQDGFLAKTREAELWNGPGARVYVTVSVKDVTPAITGGIDRKLGDRARFERIERHVKERIAACEARPKAEAPALRCRVDSFFGGLAYYETAQIEIPDLRTVYAPPMGIGDFGGETDNWRWPRHTGDWSFFRAYVAPDGRPAPHAKENVPYHPARWLRVRPAGVSDGDLVFVVGYPGRTERLQTYAEVEETTEWAFPRFIRTAQEQIDILEPLAAGDPQLAIKAASRLRSLNNYLTNRKGMLEGLLAGGILAKKQQAEQDLTRWIAADPARHAEYGDVLPALAALQAEAEKTRDRDAVFASLGRASSMLAAAETARMLAVERAKPDDLDRETEYQERNWRRIREAQQRAQKTIDARIDRPLLRWAMRAAAALPAEQRIGGLDKMVGLTAGMSVEDSNRAIDAYLDKLYAGTRLTDEAFRLGLLDKTPAELEKVSDTMVSLALVLEPTERAILADRKRRLGAESRLRPRYVAALVAQAGGPVAPDANGTLRVTYGTVKGRSGPDGVAWLPFTTLAGIEQKNTGKGEFAAPSRELAAIAALRAGKQETPYLAPALGDVPVDFLSTVDTTGGNSGSPTLSGQGELVGLLFDGTYDSIASDFVYDAAGTRSIHVDVRYLLWVMSEVDGASRLLEEMGVR